MKAKQVVSSFFEALGKGDFASVQTLYATNGMYNSPIYKGISGYEAAGMWEMLYRDSKSMVINYKVLGASRKKVRVFWTLNYVTKRNKRISTEIRSAFEVDNNQIYSHTDSFNFTGWIKQTLGTLPWLFCLTDITQTKVRERAEKKLNDFVRRR